MSQVGQAFLPVHSLSHGQWTGKNACRTRDPLIFGHMTKLPQVPAKDGRPPAGWGIVVTVDLAGFVYEEFLAEGLVLTLK